MPNIGRPSRGCTRCRQRRIKCDGRKPGCFRCEKLGQDCPGYAQPDRWLFVGQKARYTSSNSSSGQLPGSELRRQASQATVDAEVPQGLPADLESSARSFFIRTFVVNANPETASPGHLDFLPSLYLSVPEESCLTHAMTAVSLANLANHTRSNPQWSARTIQIHSKALRAINEQLTGPKAYDDDTLASVHLMALYEIMTPTYTFSSWKAHEQGACQLLRMRGADQVETATGRQLFNLIATPIVLKFISTAQLPSAESLQMIRDMYSKIYEASFNKFPALAASFLFEVGVYTAQTRNMLSRADTCSFAELISWISRGLTLEAVIGHHTSESTTETAFWHPIDSDDTSSFSFANLSFMAHWIRYWAGQLCLYNMLARVLGTVLHLTRMARQTLPPTIISFNEVVARVHNASGNITRCIGFALDRDARPVTLPQGQLNADRWPKMIGAVGINYALEMICIFPTTSDAHKALAGQGLQRIGLECGIGRHGSLTATNISPTGSPMYPTLQQAQ